MARDIHMPLGVEEIVVGESRREINAEAVAKLASSIAEIGLRHPITVRKERGGERYVLVAGLHRLEAFRRLGRDHIPAVIATMTNDEARMWEIAENLHRSELTKLQRAEHIEEWRKLKAEQVRKVSAPSGGSQPTDQGYRKTAADLGVDEAEVRSATKIAALAPEAKEAAREVGKDDNRSALLRAAREPTPEAQVRAIKLAPDPRNDLETKEAQIAALIVAWNKAGREAREEFLLRIERPVMDGRFGDAA